MADTPTPAPAPAPAIPAPPPAAAIPKPPAPEPVAKMAVDAKDWAKVAIEKAGLTGVKFGDPVEPKAPAPGAAAPAPIWNPSLSRFVDPVTKAIVKAPDVAPAPAPVGAAPAQPATSQPASDFEATMAARAKEAAQIKSQLEAQRAAIAAERARNQAEVEAARRKFEREAERARNLQALAIQDPRRFQQLAAMAQPDEQDDGDAFYGQPPIHTPRQTIAPSPPRPPATGDDEVITVGMMKKMQAAANAQAQEAAFQRTLHHDVVSQIASDPTIGPLAEPIQVYLAAKIDKDVIDGKIRVDMLPEARAVAAQYITEAKALFKAWADGRTLATKADNAAAAHALPPTSLHAATGMITPSKMTSRERAYESTADFSKRAAQVVRDYYAQLGESR